MTIQITDDQLHHYMRGLLDRHDEPVLLAMEAEAVELGFPIVERHVGVTLEILARSVGARRVFELGSGFGYSAYWFARAVGDDGEVQCTDGDAENALKGQEYLRQAGLGNRVRYHVGDAVTSLGQVGGEFDIVYCDIDKDGYPAAWIAARERVRVGGLYICDNVLWSGRVVEGTPADDVRPGWTEAIVEHNRMVTQDDTFVASILPIRDGVMVATRLR